MSVTSITHKELKSIISYDPATGIFKWLRKKWGHKGQEAGYLNIGGYRVIMINNKNYSGARLAWFYIYGKWPKDQIDHINHIRNDNRLINLREVTNQENQMNRSYTGNSSGFRGVYWDKERRKWAPKIKVNQKMIHLGRFDNLEEAISIRLMAESEYGFHLNHGLTKV